MIVYTPPAPAKTIPVVDFHGDDVPREIHKACRETGFFYVANHGAPRARRSCARDARAVARAAGGFLCAVLRHAEYHARAAALCAASGARKVEPAWRRRAHRLGRDHAARAG